MPKFLREDVDIYQLPTLDSTYGGDNSEVTIGDLHGNAMKLMFMLVKHGVAKGLNEDDYKKLVEIYEKSSFNLDKNDLDEFNDVLGKIKFNSKVGIRLIGDELADRGSNDYFTLKIMQKLRQHKVPFEVMVSNHSIEFLQASETQVDFTPPMLQWEHAVSLNNLHILIEKGLVSRDEIVDINNSVYKPSLKAIGYTLSQDKSEITIYSHAGIGLNTIQNLAKKFEVIYNDETAADLANTIDAINTVFAKHVFAGTVHTLYTREDMWAGYGADTDLSNAPLVFLMWNRFYDKIERPVDKETYKINYAHGHDSDDRTRDNIFNLDGRLGKTVHMNQGTYTVLHNQPNTIALAPTSLEAGAKKETSTLTTEPDTSIETLPEVPLTHSGIAPTIIELSDLEKIFDAQLETIKKKRDEFQSRVNEPRYKAAYEAADNLYTTIKNEFDNFTKEQNKTPEQIQAFKNNCQNAITKSRAELEEHRGWKQVLGHLALVVLGLGVLYALGVAAYKVSGAQFTLFKTDSHKQVDDLEKSLDQITKTEPKP